LPYLWSEYFSLASTEVQKYIQENDLREYMNPCFFCAITMKQAHLLSIPHLDDIPQGVTKSLQNIYIENEDINFEKMPLDRSINRPQVRAKLFGQDQQGILKFLQNKKTNHIF